jgi:hypothetical protein
MTASVLLAFAGTETLRKIHKPSQIIFAGIPVFFAFQQFAEGVIWLTMGKTGFAALQAVATFIFLLMAKVIWPVMVPCAILLMDKNKARKRILYVLQGIGAAVGLYFLYGLVFFHSQAEIGTLHIAYTSTFKGYFGNLPTVLYLGATIVPLFVSSIKRTYILGIIVVLSFAVSAVFFVKNFASVWCFFSAVMSFVIYYIIRDAHKKFHTAGSFSTNARISSRTRR